MFSIVQRSRGIGVVAALGAAVCVGVARMPAMCETKPPGQSKVDDCANPACNSTKDMFKMAMRMGGASSKKKPATEAGSAASAAGEARIPGCPADRDELGAGTWALMHALAANYPDAPTPADQARAADFFNGLAALDPCPHCAEDFQHSSCQSIGLGFSYFLL